MENLAPETPFVSSVLAFALALFVLLGFYLMRGAEGRGWILKLAMGSFLLKAILVPLYFWWLVSIGNYGFAYFDARGHHEEGINIAQEIEYDLPHNTWGWYAYDPGMYRVTAYTYMLFGANTLVIRFFLIAFASMTLWYIYKICKLYFDEPTARLAAALQAFVPFPILVSLNHRKDPITQLLMLVMLYHAIRVFRQEPGWIRSVFWVLTALVVVYPFRSGLILPFLGVMMICYVLANRNAVQGMGLTIVAVLALIVLQFGVPDDSKIHLDTYTNRAEGKLEGSADIGETTSGITSLLRVTGLTDLYKIPFAAAVYLILPFPPEFQRGEIAMLNGQLNLVGVFFLPHMMIGAWSLIRGPNWRKNLPLVVFPVVFLIVLGAVHIGLIRYKWIFYPVCLIWAAVGWRIGTTFMFKLAVYGGLSLVAIPVYLRRLGFL